MEEMMSAGDRKKERLRVQEAAEKLAAEKAKERAPYDVGSNSYEIAKRLARMEELQKAGKVEQSKKTKKDLWAKLAEQAKGRSR
jgi:hypothetical protein